MRAILFFDLPMETSNERRDYSHFRKFLIDNGFYMMQKSVYSKLFLNRNSFELLKQKVMTSLPKKGVVQIMSVTENQYSAIDYLLGKETTNVINSIEKLVIL